tara:strand:+ start:7651 stop:10050 length:2400 start_codon:yes stop_codon:yes gene_type:complete
MSYSQGITLKGIITDANGNYLKDVNIREKKSSRGTISNGNGSYQLNLPFQKKYSISFSHINHQDITLEISLKDVQEEIQKTNKNYITRNFILEKTNESLENVDLIDINKEESRFKGITKITLQSIEKIPTISESIESILKSLPGVSSNNELSNQYSVRGGSFDENLIYVNGIEIYKSFLTKSAQQEGLSFINPKLTSSIDFFAGGFEAKYGDKLSSVLDVKYKEPKKNKRSFSTSLMGTNLTLEGNNKNYRLSYILGHRYKTNQFLINSLDLDGNFIPKMHDFQAYLTYQLTPETKLSFLGYHSNNIYEMIPESRETQFGTITESLQLTIYFNGQEVDKFKTSLGAVSFNYTPNENTDIKLTTSIYRTKEEVFYDIQGEYWLGQLENNIGSDDFGDVVINRGIGSYMNHARNEIFADVFNSYIDGKMNFFDHKINWGFKYQHEKIEDNIREWEAIDSAGYTISNNSDSGLEMYNFLKGSTSLSSNRITNYIQGKSKNYILNNGATINYTAGIRTNYWDFNNEFFISPRFIVGYKPNWNKDFIFSGSIGSYNQSPFFREIRNKYGDINENIKSQKSIHYVLSSDYQFSLWDRPFKFNASAYYKYLWDLIPYEINNLQINYLTNKIASGYATGLDLKLFGEFVPGVDSWFSLSLLSTQEDILGDGYGFIPKPTDQRLKCSIFFQDYLPTLPKYKVNLNLTYGSGLPFGPNNSRRDQQILRMPSYKRMDIGFSRIIKESDFISKNKFFNFFETATISAEIYNLLGIRNTGSYIWITDSSNNKYAVPNYLTSRLLNLKLSVEF